MALDSKIKSYAAAAVILCIGFCLRLIFGEDIEFKWDEAYSYARAVNFGKTEGWSWVGMPSSVGIVNPGMSLWPFIAFAQIFPIHTPVDLARCVQLLNCLALVVLVGITLTRPSAQERSTWLWGMALACVNPISIILQRKIWAQSLTPFFVALSILFWIRRERFWFGSFGWGFIGTLIGQIHMAGFFYTPALALWTFLFDSSKRTRWKAWILGSIFGALPLIPWLYHLGGIQSVGNRGFEWSRLFTFWTYWFSGAFSLNLGYSMGNALNDFSRYPILGGQPIYLAGILQKALWLLLFSFIVMVLVQIKNKKFTFTEYFFGRGSDTALLTSAYFWCSGICMTLAMIPLYHHYFVVAFPIPFIWLAQHCLRFGKLGKSGLALLFLIQFLLSSLFLGYVHIRGGIPEGDYWIAYSRQQRSHN